jgi:chromosomal replication initiator protein
MNHCEICICELPSSDSNYLADDIINKSCVFFGLSRVQISKHCRKREFVEPRQMLMFLLSAYTRLTLNKICELLDGWHHTTIIHSRETVRNLINTDLDYAYRFKAYKKFVLEK